MSYKNEWFFSWYKKGSLHSPTQLLTFSWNNLWLIGEKCFDMEKYNFWGYFPSTSPSYISYCR